MGDDCKYSGENNRNEDVIKLCEKEGYVKICPEVMGGLPTPRCPSEIVRDSVISKDGDDFTEYFKKGAEISLKLAEENNIKKAVLKAKSPSCGYGKIYDGTFTGTLKEGNGIAAQLLSENGIEIITEEDLKAEE